MSESSYGFGGYWFNVCENHSSSYIAIEIFETKQKYDDESDFSMTVHLNHAITLYLTLEESERLAKIILDHAENAKKAS